MAEEKENFNRGQTYRQTAFRALCRIITETGRVAE